MSRRFCCNLTAPPDRSRSRARFAAIRSDGRLPTGLSPSNATGAASSRISAAHHRHQRRAAAHLRRITRSDRAARSDEHASVVQHDAQQRTVNLEREVAAIFDEAELLEFVQKEVHARARRADHLRERFL
jgi:hypothetical protein